MRDRRWRGSKVNRHFRPFVTLGRQADGCSRAVMLLAQVIAPVDPKTSQIRGRVASVIRKQELPNRRRAIFHAVIAVFDRLALEATGWLTDVAASLTFLRVSETASARVRTVALSASENPAARQIAASRQLRGVW